MQFRLLPILLLFVTTHLFSNECPQPTGLFTDNYIFNSSYASVNANWESLLGTDVQHFLVNYKQLDSLEWNNLANLDSTSTSKIIPFLDFNTTYVWRVGSFCSENYQDPAQWSIIDTFTTMEYIDCPEPTNIYSDNIIVTEVTGFADSHWDSMLDMGVDHFLLGYKNVNDTSWSYISNMDSTINSRTIGGDLIHNNYYEWRIQAYCSQNQSYYSEWSVRDTFYISNFVAEEFTPEFNINLSSLICEELSDINFITEQGLNEPDIQSTSITSNLGYINLDNLEMGQNVGNATVIAGINNFINNEYTLEISEINSVENSIEIDLVNDIEETQFSFTIENLEVGGVEMSIVSPSDNNSYTSGNSLDINLTGIFMNPSPSLLQFDVTVFSELNDDIFNQFDFNIDCANTIATFYNINLFYPNPTYSVVNLMVENLKAIKIFDTKGQLMLFDENPNSIIDVSQLSQGLYLVEIISDEKSSVEQLIVR
jgi:hypothetical protein